MSREANKQVARRLIEDVWDRADLASLADLLAPDVVFREPISQELRGREVLGQFISAYRMAFPDMRFAIEEQIAEGDLVVTRWVARGSHQGQFRQIPPSGNAVQVRGTSTQRFADGKIVEDWTDWDALGLMQQIGVIPAIG
jgi:steroid delta-isomerase-like uncharacterized protein